MEREQQAAEEMMFSGGLEEALRVALRRLAELDRGAALAALKEITDRFDEIVAREIDSATRFGEGGGYTREGIEAAHKRLNLTAVLLWAEITPRRNA